MGVSSPPTPIARRRRTGRGADPRAVDVPAAMSGLAAHHGLRDRRLLLPGESAGEWAQFAAALRIDLAPQGALEEVLIERIVQLLWRLRRVPWVEAGLLRAHTFDHRRQRLLQTLLSAPLPVPASAHPRLDAEAQRALDPENDLGRAFERTILRGDGITKLARYETTLERALRRALRHLAGVCGRRGRVETSGGATPAARVESRGRPLCAPRRARRGDVRGF